MGDTATYTARGPAGTAVDPAAQLAGEAAGPAATGGVGGADLGWLRRERSNICAAITMACDSADERLGPAGWRLADAMLGYVRLWPGDGDWAKAVRAAARSAARSGNGRAYAGMLLNAADAEYREGRTAAERIRAREALAVARTAGWRAGEGLALAALGRSHWSVGSLPLADRYLRRALAVHRAIDDPAGEAGALGRLARSAHDRGDLRSALRDYKRALGLADAADSRFGRVRLPAHIALALADLGRYEQAARWSEPAYRLSREAAFPEGVALALTCRAVVLANTGALEAALRTVAEAHAAIGDLADPRAAADCLNRLAGVEAAAGSPGAAERGHGKALQLARTTGYRQGAAAAHAGLAAEQVGRGRYEEAAASCRSALAAAGTELRLVRARVLLAQADIALAAGSPSGAVARCREAEALFRDAGDRLGEVRALLAWGRVADAVPGHGAALRPWRRGVWVASSVGAGPERDTLRSLLGVD
ncbi:hypothetical protein G5C51_36705 [Streptomyces sp. A7024]|uniref:Uncharacterized protein n=1 Tax=Streptomyces coryli TaxID=1128680 RepID=A0A6G4UDJ5_9ACTN|nr:hypothetical protein [Streptomyces coryli]